MEFLLIALQNSFTDSDDVMWFMKNDKDTLTVAWQQLEKAIVHYKGRPVLECESNVNVATSKILIEHLFQNGKASMGCSLPILS